MFLPWWSPWLSSEAHMGLGPRAEKGLSIWLNQMCRVASPETLGLGASWLGTEEN